MSCCLFQTSRVVQRLQSKCILGFEAHTHEENLGMTSNFSEEDLHDYYCSFGSVDCLCEGRVGVGDWYFLGLTL
jgi:hypothetical protein